ncbi:uncharacterized protein LOC120427343 [Culex pipiens pallens]|uniref:uncharacterized protein LOC120427343 n=1 Tax=Culex pipiens pallens TaxID=42434 RepID=UPI001954D383|nr:uncharacterized protein LOC120427343 [Culex pipiens pallens]
MRLLRAALVTLFVVGTDVLTVPPVAARSITDQDRIDPLKSEDSLSDVVHRPKRRFKPEELAAANQVLDSLYLGQRRIGVPDPPLAPSTEPPPPPPTKKKPTLQQKKIQKKRGKQARQANDDDDPDPDENAVDGGDGEDRLVGENGKVTLQIPGKLFGNATNLFLAAAKLVGDFITNSAIRSARFLQLFQPVFGRTLFIQIPTTTTESNDI